MNNSLNLIEFLKLVYKWRKPVLIVMGIGILGSVVITDPHIMPPYYESVSLIYPLNPNLTQSSNLFGDNAQGYFGTSADVDRILSIAGSVPLKMFIVKKFDLFKHYKIDSTRSKYPVEAVLRELHNNYTFEKNDRGAIEVTVYDRDPQVAADMANAIVAKIDETNQALLNDNKQKILSIYEVKLKEKQGQLQALGDTIFKLKQEFSLYSNIQDLPGQVSKLRAEKGAGFDQATEKVKVLEEQKKGAIRELNNNMIEYEQYKATINSTVPTVYVLEKAFKAERKSKPIRWLIVLGTILVTFVLSALTILMIERFRSFRIAFQKDTAAAPTST
ncbi:MAG TPA: hypothetical protein PLD84_03085 [Chitinophagales bacterium]|nr:hypothetical protein [Chitinophagales bacterium]